MDSLEQTYRPLLEAVSFASRAHQGQTRKDGRTPYASHVFRVCLVVRHVFGIDDPQILTAAVLHDAVEDTTTDADDLHERYGADVAAWVGLLSKDKRLLDGPREEQYKAGLRSAPWQVKLCKLADVFDNALDVANLPPERRRKTLARSRSYLAALDAPDLPAPARRAWEIVARLVDEVDKEE